MPRTKPDPAQLLSVAEAARELGVSAARVYALIAAERLPVTRVGRALVIRAADLERVRVRTPGRPWPVKA